VREEKGVEEAEIAKEYKETERREEQRVWAEMRTRKRREG
jgi:hypothetical protein